MRFGLVGMPLVDGTEIGVVCRRRGKETTLQVVKIRRGTVSVQVPPSTEKDQTLAWFLIPGLSRMDQFERFLEHPEKWNWAQTQTRRSALPSVGPKMAPNLQIVPKGQSVQFRGRVLDPDRSPLETLTIRYSMSSTNPGWSLGCWMHSGYDPATGRFWMMRSLPKEAVLDDWRFDFLPSSWSEVSHPRIAPLLGVPLLRHEEQTIKMPEGATLRGKLRCEGLTARDYRLHLRLQGSRPMERSSDQLDGFTFDGLPKGVYTLEILRHGATNALWEQRGVHLKEGENLNLGIVDLSEKIALIKVTVRDPEGNAIRANIGPVRYLKRYRRFTVSMLVARNEAPGVCSLLVPKRGTRLVVEANGWGTQIFNKVRQDLEVTLRRSHRLNLRVIGMAKTPQLLEDLYLRAQPVTGYPDWAWKLLAKISITQGRRARSNEILTMPCMAGLKVGNPRSMLIPRPGLWKFELVYAKRYLHVLIPLPNLESVQIQRAEQELVVELPSAILRRARARFEALQKQK